MTNREEKRIVLAHIQEEVKKLRTHVHLMNMAIKYEDLPLDLTVLLEVAEEITQLNKSLMSSAKSLEFPTSTRGFNAE